MCEMVSKHSSVNTSLNLNMARIEPKWNPNGMLKKRNENEKLSKSYTIYTTQVPLHAALSQPVIISIHFLPLIASTAIIQQHYTWAYQGRLVTIDHVSDPTILQLWILVDNV